MTELEEMEEAADDEIVEGFIDLNTGMERLSWV